MSVLGSVSFLINAIILVESKDATYLFCFTSSFRSQRWFSVCIYKCTLTTRNQTKHLHFLYIASGFAEQIHLSSHHFRLIHLAKKPSPVFPWTTFFSRRYTADMARPRVDDLSSWKKKTVGKREKLEPPKSHGGLDGLQMIFSF